MRYIKLYFVCFKRAIISRLQYKADTIIGIVGFLISNTATLLSIYFIINSIPSLNGWSLYELGFLYGFSMMPVAFDHFFSDELWVTAYWKVKSGKLDPFFLRPVSVLFQIIAEAVQPEAFGELILGGVMLGVCASNVGVKWSFAFIMLLVVATIFGGLLITGVKIFFTAFALKFKRSGSLLQAVYNMISYTRYPISIYPLVLRTLLTCVLPFAVIISMPVEAVLFSAYNPYLLSLIIIGVSGLVLSLSVVFWNWMERFYQSTGS